MPPAFHLTGPQPISSQSPSLSSTHIKLLQNEDVYQRAKNRNLVPVFVITGKFHSLWEVTNEDTQNRSSVVWKQPERKSELFCLRVFCVSFKRQPQIYKLQFLTNIHYLTSTYCTHMQACTHNFFSSLCHLHTHARTSTTYLITDSHIMKKQKHTTHQHPHTAKCYTHIYTYTHIHVYITTKWAQT